MASRCVDCSAQTASYYSYKYKVNICKKCSKIHEDYLGKEDEFRPEKALLRPSRSFDCLSSVSEGKERERIQSNKELEIFLPDFYQKMGVNTPMVIRKEFIIAKYVNKLFTSPAGVNNLLAPLKIGILLKKRSVHSGWRPCYVRLNKRECNLEYFSYKSSRFYPKCSINMEKVEVFVERLPRERPLAKEEFYLHLIWKKDELVKKKPRLSIFKKIPLDQSNDDDSDILHNVRNLYFCPTTDTEFFQWYVALLSAKYALVFTNTFKGHRYSGPVKRNSAFVTSNIYCQLDVDPNYTLRKSMFVPVNVTEDSNECDYTEMSSVKESIDPLSHFLEVPSPNLVPKTLSTLPEAKLIEFSGSYCMDTNSPQFFTSCREKPFSQILAEVHSDEVELDIPKIASKIFLDSSFYSCRPRSDTNPFVDIDTPPNTGDQEANGLDTTRRNPFQLKDFSPLDEPIYRLGADNPVFQENSPPASNLQVSTDKDSWINTPVVLSHVRTNNKTPLDSCPIDLDYINPVSPDVSGENFYGSIREDMSLNRKLYFKSGWLSKVGERKSDRWRIRWFTLYNHHLTYSDHQFSTFPNGQFMLDSDQKGYGVDFTTSMFHMVPSPTRHAFRIVTPGRTYYLCAYSEREQKVWVETISRVIALAYVLT